MVVPVTHGVSLSPAQLEQVEAFLERFLPRMRTAPGVVEILPFADPEARAGHDDRALGER